MRRDRRAVGVSCTLIERTLPTCCTLGFALSALGFVLALSGCLDRDLKALNPCTVSGVVENIRVTNVEKVDLLFMVDNSNSMAEEQTSLAEQLPNLVRVLASGDANGDGVEDFPPVKDLHVGVVSSDMGTGGFAVDTCGESDDGILQTDGRTDISGCMATYPKVLEFAPERGDPDAFAQDFQCLAQLGTGGCGFEQQLEAVLKALTPSGSTGAGAFDGTFANGTTGHGDTENAGFLREDSLLGVVVVTDEEDCSAADPDLFNPDTTRYGGNPNLRCFLYPEAVQPVERYTDGLLALRDGNPDLLVYAAIAGVPPGLVDLDADNDGELDRQLTPSDYEEILEAELMQEMIDPDDSRRLRPSCNVPGRGLAFPPRRIVRVAQQLEERGSNGIVQSICQDNFAPALDAIVDKIADVLGGACLPRQLTPDGNGTVGCDVVEVLPSLDSGSEFTRCEQIPGREFLRVEEGREVCRVAQRPVIDGEVPTQPGWYYDNFSADVDERCGDRTTPEVEGQRISFVTGAEPKTGTSVRLECLQPVTQVSGTEPGDITIGTACRQGETPDVCPGAGLTCDMQTNTCEQSCDTDADCTEDGLAGWRCDPNGFCRNPTCG